jgi:hypothetical protein
MKRPLRGDGCAIVRIAGCPGKGMPPPDGLTEARGAAFLEALAHGRESRPLASTYSAVGWRLARCSEECASRACTGSAEALVVGTL